MPEPTPVLVGQVWADRDRRFPDRRITINTTDPDGFTEVYSWYEDRADSGVRVRIRTEAIPRRFRLITAAERDAAGVALQAAASIGDARTEQSAVSDA